MTEVLVVLAILSLTITVFATSRPGPSPAMQQEARISEIIGAAANARAQAIIQGTQQTLQISGPLCPDSPDTFIFFPNGTAAGTRICLASDIQNTWLQLDPFTAHLTRVTTP